MGIRASQGTFKLHAAETCLTQRRMVCAGSSHNLNLRDSNMKFLQTASLAWALASFVGGCRVTAAAPWPDAPDLHGLGAALEPSLRQYHVPTVAIAVVDHGKIVLDTVLTDNKSAVPSDTRFEA